jgi:hypothetical protein
MDEQRFDTLAKSIGALRSRRRMLTALSGTALAGALGLRGREAAAAPKPANAKCSSDTQCASGTCIKYDTCRKNGKFTGRCRCACTGTDCPTGHTCSNPSGPLGACFPQCPQAGLCNPDFTSGFISCGSKKRCTCLATAPTDTGPACVQGGVVCDTVQGCTTTANCPLGQVCTDDVNACRCGKAKMCLNPCGVGLKTPQR